MNIAKLLLSITILLTLNAGTSQSQTPLTRDRDGRRAILFVNTGWQFREAGKDKWYPATVPGCVHTDLLSNKLIEDPFYRDDEQKLQWIGKTDWEYQTTFNIPPDTYARKNLELVFAGLDYLSAPNYAGAFADNYFDLIPGRKVEVEFRGAGPLSLIDFRKRLTIRSLADAF